MLLWAVIIGCSHELGNMHPLLLVGAEHGVLLNVHLIVLVDLARVASQPTAAILAITHFLVVVIHVFYLNVAYIPVAFHFTLIHVWCPNQRRIFVLLPESTVAALHHVHLREPQHRINIKIAPPVLLAQARVQKRSASLREFAVEYKHSAPSHQLLKSLLRAE